MLKATTSLLFEGNNIIVPSQQYIDTIIRSILYYNAKCSR